MSGEYFEAWEDWRRWGNYPYPGGRNAQPLDLLVHIRAIDLTYETYTHKNRKTHDGKPADLSKLTATQQELMIWLDKDD